MRINRHDTNGTKPLLGKGELGYDDYTAGGDTGRVYVGNGSENIPQAKKSEVVTVDGKIDTHIGRVDNPHTVTKAQVGLGNVDNTADVVKNVLSATKLTTARNIALSGDVTGSVSFDGSANATIVATVADNSHLHTIANITGLQTALDNKVDDSEKGSANGVATLDVNGKVTLTQIPDSVLGQLEYQGVWDFTTLPTATQKGQYWIASVSGNGYIIGDWAVWNGVSFDKVDNTDAVATVAGRTGNIVLTKTDVGLGNVDNTADSAKPVSTAQQTALNLKANLASPVFTGNVAGLGVATGTSFNSITGLSSVVGAASGTAAVGTSTTVARADHVHPSDTTKVTKVTSTDNAIVRFNGTTGDVQNSGVVINDDNALINNSAGLSIAPAASGMTSLYNWLDTSSLDIWAGVTQKTGIHINGQTASGGSYFSVNTGGVQRMLLNGNGMTITGAISASTNFIGALTGNSSTTTALQTARTLTIGSTGKTFDGTANVSWSVAEIGAQPVDADLTAISALAGTSGLLKKTAADTWTLDTSAYVTSSGVTSVTGTAPIVSSGGNTPAISISAATTSAAGSMSAADKTKLDGIATNANNYTLPTATSTAIGGVKVSATAQTVAGNAVTATASRSYAVQLDASGNALVNVPWVDTNTVYTHPTSGVTAGSYSKVTVDANGHVTAGLTPTMEDIPDATFKRSVRAATTANITLSAAQTIDGIVLAVGDRVLVKDQTTTSQNGIYVVAAGAWTRALDADTASKIASALVAVDSGTVNGGKLFDNDFKTTDTLDTTAMQWSMNLDDGSLLTSGSTSIGTVRYNGTTAVAGQFDGGTTTPTGTVRLNYGGYFYPSYINLTGSADTTITSSHVFVETGSDGYVRPKTLANFKTEMFASPTLVTPNIGVATGTSFNSITGLSTVVGTTSGTAAVGTSTTVARADHVHPIQTTITGNAGTATTLATARTINGVSFNGSANITISDSTKVALTGNETIAGIKTFSSSPIVPTPTTNTQVANKAYVDGKYSGFKNYIINGNFDIWQYGTSQTVTGYGSDDRWINRNIGSTKTNYMVNATDTERALFNASKFSRTVVSSVAGVGNVVDKYQKIEDVTKLAGKTVTLSFWAKADSNKNIVIEFWQHFGTGGSPSDAVLGISCQLVALTSTWQKFTKTVTLPSIVGKTLGTDGVHTSYSGVNFWLDAGSIYDTRTNSLGQQSGTFDIAQVQLEEGSVATPFEQRPYGLELSLCQRYYLSGIELLYAGNVTNGIYYSAMLLLPVIMRTAPTATFRTNRSLTGFAQPTVAVLEPDRFSCSAIADVTGPATWDVLYDLSAEL